MVVGLAVLGLLGACRDGATPEQLARAVPSSTEASAMGLATATTAATTTPPTSTTTSAAATTTAVTTPPETAMPPETTALPETTAPPETTTTAAPVDLQAVDWANRTYWLPCPPGLPDNIETTLVDGEHRGDRYYHALYEVVHGEMGTPRRPVAVLRFTCIAATSMPSPVLVFDGSGPEEVELGIVASVVIWRERPGQNSWQVEQPMVIEDGVLIMTGRGWTGASGHCCPDLYVVSKVILAEDGTLQEIEHSESPRTVTTAPG